MSKHHFQTGETNHEHPKTVVIMGVARGGTSMVAGTAREMGIFLGDQVGENHEDQRFLTFDLDKLRERVAERNAERETWGWKMPHSLQYIEQLQDDLRNPHYVLVWRNALASAISQVRRSNADINNALEFSGNKLQEMITKVPLLNGPVLMINYEQAVANKDDFIDTLAGYLGVEVDDEMRERCMKFIDPSVGYQQISASFYRSERVEDAVCDKPFGGHQVLRKIEEDDETGDLKPLARFPKMIFRMDRGIRMPKNFYLRLTNTGSEPAPFKIYYDYEWKFSEAVAQRHELEPGTHTYLIETTGQLIRFAVGPLTEIGEVSPIRDVEVFLAPHEED